MFNFVKIRQRIRQIRQICDLSLNFGKAQNNYIVLYSDRFDRAVNTSVMTSKMIARNNIPQDQLRLTSKMR